MQCGTSTRRARCVLTIHACTRKLFGAYPFFIEHSSTGGWPLEVALKRLIAQWMLCMRLSVPWRPVTAKALRCDPWRGCMNANAIPSVLRFSIAPTWSKWTPRVLNLSQRRKHCGECVCVGWWGCSFVNSSSLKRFLARYHESKGQWKEAERYAMRLLDFAVPEKDEAKAMLKRLHVRQQQAADVADANAPRPASATGVGFLPSLAPGKRHH